MGENAAGAASAGGDNNVGDVEIGSEDSLVMSESPPARRGGARPAARRGQRSPSAGQFVTPPSSRSPGRRVAALTKIFDKSSLGRLGGTVPGRVR